MALYTLAYCRNSTKEQDFQTQLHQLEGAGFDELFVEHISGGKKERPEFDRLAERAIELRKQGHEVVILVVELSRWARDTIVSLSRIEKLEDVGVKIREVAGGAVSLKTATEFLVTGMKSVYAEYYRRELSERIHRSYDRRRAQGAPLCTKPPFGYQHAADKTKLEPDPERWQIAREIVARALKGDSLYSIRKWMWEEYGIKRKERSLKLALLSDAWRGHIVDLRNDRVLYNRHEPLLSEAEYKQIKHRFDLSKQLRGRNVAATVYPIPSGGVVRCHDCNLAMQTVTSNGKRHFRCITYGCQYRNKYLRQDAIEAAIQNEIADMARLIGERMNRAESSIDPRILQLEAEIEQLRPLQHREAIAAEIERIELEIDQLKSVSEVETLGAKERRKLIADLEANTPQEWAAIATADRRAVYTELVEKVTCKGREIVDVKLRI